MTNPLLTYVNPAKALAVYQNVQQNLGWDHLIFDAMHQIAQNNGFPFDLPTAQVDYARKHQEIEQILSRYPKVLNRHHIFFELLEEIHLHLLSAAGPQHADRLRSLAVLDTNRGFQVKLTTDTAWLIEWNLSIPSESSDTRQVSAVVYERKWHHVVPWSVIQYLNSGIFLYKESVYTTALALMAIAVEATLRDVLATRGYGYFGNASRVDVYDYSSAQFDSQGTGYSLNFTSIMPASASDLSASAGSKVPVDVKVCRKINNRGNFDLHIKEPPIYLLDHLSSDHVVQAGQPKHIGGLGEALSVARNTEHLITPYDLPTDVDEVLKAVRNNLIHLSNDSLNVELPRYASLSANGKFTVGDFTRRQDLVFDIVTDIPRFVNDQYENLWKSGAPVV